MLLALLFAVSRSDSSADLQPPFHPDEDGAIGYWMFDGSAVVQEQSIILCPPIQFRRGAAWTTVEFPNDFWSVKFTFDVTGSDPVGCGGGAGIFFVKTLGAEGPLHGGPNQFKGLAVLLTVSESKMTDSRRVEVAVIQSFGNVAFSLPIKANATLEVRNGHALDIRVRVAERILSVLGSAGGEREKTLVRAPLDVDISQNYLGVTAQTQQHVNVFELRGVEWDVEIRRAKDVSFAKGSGKYAPNLVPILRSPKFNVTVDEMGRKVEVPNGESNAVTLLDVIEEAGAAMRDVASFMDVNDFVKTTIVPYTVKWRKRNVRVIEEVGRVREMMEATLNYTDTLVRDLRWAVESLGYAMAAKIEDLEIEMVEEMYADEKPKSGVKMTADPVEYDFVMALLYLSLFEILIGGTYLILQKNARFKERYVL